MKNYKLEAELNQKIVDGLMEGYRDYLEVRKERSDSMRVSGAYAWVKGNHIDDKIASACESYGVKSELAKAGLTWQYLQFKHNDEKVLFIVKNARYFDKEQVDQGKDIKGKTKKEKMSYMSRLMNINSGIDFDDVKTVKPSGSVQLELLEKGLSRDVEDEIGKIGVDFNRFYIVTYEIDESQLISKISLFMPNPVNNKAYMIDDLTAYINTSHDLIIDEKLKDVLMNSNEMSEGNLYAYNYDIALDEDVEEVDKES